MLIQSREAAPFYKNGYVVACERTREAVVIDPGDEVGELVEVVAGQGLQVRHILVTHGHVDHVSGAALAKRAWNAPLWLHGNDLPLYEAAPQQGALFGFDIEPLPPVDRCYDSGQPIAFGDLEARVLQTPGHTPGGVCLLVGPAGQPGQALFSGDTLFAGSIGRTDLHGGDYGVLIASIREVLLALPDRLPVHAGHGPATTIGVERRTNPFLVGK